MKDKDWFNLYKENGFHMLDSCTQECLAHFNSVISFSKIAINGILILNGSAAVAILSNFEKLSNIIGCKALLCCSAGALSAVVCSGFSYVAQLIYANFILKSSSEYIRYYYFKMSTIYNRDTCIIKK